MGYRNQAQEAAAQAAARGENAKRETIQGVYNRHHEFVHCEANERAIIETVVRWTQNPEILPSAELFEIALEADPDSITSFATQSVERTKEQIRDEILSLLAAHSRRDEFMLKSEASRMKSWTLESLRFRLAELKTKIHMVSQPVSELKKFVADAHREDRPFPGWPTLPKSMWSSAQGRTITIDADYLNHIGNHDRYEFARVVKIYGSAQIDHRRGLK